MTNVHSPPAGVALGKAQDPREPDTDAGRAYVTMIEELRAFLDAVAGARPDESTIVAMSEQLGAWTKDLQLNAVDEGEQVFARRLDVPGFGQSMCPAVIIEHVDDSLLSGWVTFGRYFLGANGAVHGGAISLLFDDLLGRLSVSGTRTRSRTAYLRIDYRSVTPIETELKVRAWFESEVGRKRLLRGEIWNGDILCAEAEALFVTLRPGQP